MSWHNSVKLAKNMYNLTEILPHFAVKKKPHFNF
jgi:hypothetical protein